MIQATPFAMLDYVKQSLVTKQPEMYSAIHAPELL